MGLLSFLKLGKLHFLVNWKRHAALMRGENLFPKDTIRFRHGEVCNSSLKESTSWDSSVMLFQYFVPPSSLAPFVLPKLGGCEHLSFHPPLPIARAEYISPFNIAFHQIMYTS